MSLHTYALGAMYSGTEIEIGCVAKKSTIELEKVV